MKKLFARLFLYDFTVCPIYPPDPPYTKTAIIIPALSLRHLARQLISELDLPTNTKHTIEPDKDHFGHIITLYQYDPDVGYVILYKGVAAAPDFNHTW